MEWPLLTRAISAKQDYSTAAKQDDHLCETCNTLDFRSLDRRRDVRKLRQPPEEHRKALVALGPFRETIDQTACGFCRLARHAVESHDSHTTQVVLVCRWEYGLQIERHATALELLTDYRAADCMGKARLPHCISGSIEGILVDTKSVYGAQEAIEQAKRWLSQCTTSHINGRCSAVVTLDAGTAGRAFTFSHVIDVYERCVIRADSLSPLARFEPYFALSYVNGSAKFLELTRENEGSLSSPGALSEDVLPRTFNDTLLFTGSCKVRYLWIDALCIRQGDANEVEAEIRKMRDKYQQAELVLVATLGNTPHFGLFPRAFQDYAIHGVQFSQPTHKTRGRTTYHTRAWCYQEENLASRGLEFRADTIRFRCGAGIQQTEMSVVDTGQGSLCSIDANVDSVTPSHILLEIRTQLKVRGTLMAQSGLSTEFLDCYNDLVGDYLVRSLTYSQDVLRAFEGMSALIADSTNTSVLYGLPVVLFPFCLFWATAEPSKQNLDTSEIPSWTWASSGVSARLIRGSLIPFWNWQWKKYSMIRYVSVASVDIRATEGHVPGHNKAQTLIDISKHYQLAENAVQASSTPCVASDRCQHGVGILNFVSYAIPTTEFLVTARRDYKQDDYIDVLYRDNHRTVKTRPISGARGSHQDTSLAGIVYGVDPVRDPWKDPPSNKPLVPSSSYFVALAMLSSWDGDIDVRKNYHHSIYLRDDHYMCLIVSQQQGDVTCERIGLAMIKRSIFHECGPEQRLIHLV